jgi:hypothetical protein
METEIATFELVLKPKRQIGVGSAPHETAVGRNICEQSALPEVKELKSVNHVSIIGFASLMSMGFLMICRIWCTRTTSVASFFGRYV